MRYVKVSWSHDFPDEPVLYLSELGEDGYEVRKVQVYRDGRCEWADETFETATVGLSEIPFPPLVDISSQPEFTAELITSEEFERAWEGARLNS
ncbi:hypothetical protein FNQ90_14530 [Streptomyces alkaliphilus]|uniref:DUF6881 domain-containing protein n=1 Tax=Streptomyces alkaliphilus TaxID=1472722 RepID=A0A7W3TEB8_9ACTN|nr:hypothetical protein [Streptomyces alkaliphilus]MBB0245284.1 hypothetical protein [Streptomyces alkaliphilus]